MSQCSYFLVGFKNRNRTFFTLDLTKNRGN